MPLERFCAWQLASYAHDHAILMMKGVYDGDACDDDGYAHGGACFCREMTSDKEPRPHSPRENVCSPPFYSYFQLSRVLKAVDASCCCWHVSDHAFHDDARCSFSGAFLMSDGLPSSLARHRALLHGDFDLACAHLALYCFHSS